MEPFRRSRGPTACLLPLGLVGLMAACSGASNERATTASRTFESRLVLAGGIGRVSARSPVDDPGIAWVTGFRAQAVEAASGRSVGEHAPWHADLRLRNGTRLIAAAAGHPALSFPAGFGLPLEQLLDDTPEGWRGVDLVSSWSGSSAGPDVEITVKATLDYVGPEDGPGDGPALKRLYVLGLPVVDAADEVWDGASTDEGDLLADTRARREVPPGATTWTAEFAYLVPVDCTVHFAFAHLEGPAKSVRLVDLTDGKPLWEGEVLGGGIPPYSSETGFPLSRDRRYRIEASFDNPDSSPSEGAAVLYLYYRLPGDETFSYPFPPAGGGGSR